jgi:hypothetical protein
LNPAGNVVKHSSHGLLPINESYIYTNSDWFTVLVCSTRLLGLPSSPDLLNSTNSVLITRNYGFCFVVLVVTLLSIFVHSDNQNAAERSPVNYFSSLISSSNRVYPQNPFKKAGFVEFCFYD